MGGSGVGERRELCRLQKVRTKGRVKSKSVPIVLSLVLVVIGNSKERDAGCAYETGTLQSAKKSDFLYNTAANFTYITTFYYNLLLVIHNNLHVHLISSQMRLREPQRFGYTNPIATVRILCKEACSFEAHTFWHES